MTKVTQSRYKERIGGLEEGQRMERKKRGGGKATGSHCPRNGDESRGRELPDTSQKRTPRMMMTVTTDGWHRCARVRVGSWKTIIFRCKQGSVPFCDNVQ